MPSGENEGEEPEWEDYITNKTVAEQGFGLINSLHLAVIECFFEEVKNSTIEKEKGGATGEGKDSSGQVYSEDKLILAVTKYFEKGSGEQYHWPELIRLILKSRSFSMSPLTDRI